MSTCNTCNEEITDVGLSAPRMVCGCSTNNKTTIIENKVNTNTIRLDSPTELIPALRSLKKSHISDIMFKLVKKQLLNPLDLLKFESIGWVTSEVQELISHSISRDLKDYSKDQVMSCLLDLMRVNKADKQDVITYGSTGTLKETIKDRVLDRLIDQK